jgi:hypothetical protein
MTSERRCSGSRFSSTYKHKHKHRHTSCRRALWCTGTASTVGEAAGPRVPTRPTTGRLSTARQAAAAHCSAQPRTQLCPPVSQRMPEVVERHEARRREPHTDAHGLPRRAAQELHHTRRCRAPMRMFQCRLQSAACLCQRRRRAHFGLQGSKVYGTGPSPSAKGPAVRLAKPNGVNANTPHLRRRRPRSCGGGGVMATTSVHTSSRAPPQRAPCAVLQRPRTGPYAVAEPPPSGRWNARQTKPARRCEHRRGAAV